MTLPRTNVYLVGVGGQGIGLLSEVLTLACADAGYGTTGCDTLGIAQRGGTVVSHLRIGSPPLFGPLVPRGQADIILGLERLETERAVYAMLRPGGFVLCGDAVHQPMAVRLDQASYPPIAALERAVNAMSGRLDRVPSDIVPEPTLLNVALLGRLVRSRVIEGLEKISVVGAMRRVMSAPALLEKNLAVFDQASTGR